MAWVLIIFGILFIAGGVIYRLYFYEKSSKDPRDQIRNLQERYDPNITRTVAVKEADQSSVRTGLVKQFNAEVEAVTGMLNKRTEGEVVAFRNEHIGDQLKREEEFKHQQHLHDVDNLMLQRNLVSFAQDQGMDVSTYLEVLKTRALNSVEMQRIEDEAKAQLKAGFIYQLKDYQHISMLRGALDDLYERSWQIETGKEPEPVRQRKLAQIEEDIRLHEEDIGARRKRLLQASNGEEAQGSNQDSDSPGNAG